MLAKAQRRRTQDELERTRELLCEYVVASGVRPGALAERVELQPRVLADILRAGGEDFPLFRLHQILRALGVAPRDFYGRLYGLHPVERGVRRIGSLEWRPRSDV